MWRRLPGWARTLWVQVMWVLPGRCERMGLVDSKMQGRNGVKSDEQAFLSREGDIPRQAHIGHLRMKTASGNYDLTHQ